MLMNVGGFGDTFTVSGGKRNLASEEFHKRFTSIHSGKYNGASQEGLTSVTCLLYPAEDFKRMRSIIAKRQTPPNCMVICGDECRKNSD